MRARDDVRLRPLQQVAQLCRLGVAQSRAETLVERDGHATANLAARFARGEISTEEFRERLDALR